MFGDKELELLRLQRELIEAESDILRQRAQMDVEKLLSAGYWLERTTNYVKRHPALTTALSLGIGLTAVQALRKPTGTLGLIGRLSSLGALGLKLWQRFNRS